MFIFIFNVPCRDTPILYIHTPYLYLALCLASCAALFTLKILFLHPAHESLARARHRQAKINSSSALLSAIFPRVFSSDTARLVTLGYPPLFCDVPSESTRV